MAGQVTSNVLVEWPRSSPATSPERNTLSAQSALSILSAWQAASADILARIDEPDLPVVLDAALKRLAPYDLSCAFAYPDEAAPLFIYNGLDASGRALDNYLKGAHLLDPFSTACARRVPDGLYRMRDLAPDNFFEGEYFNSWEVHPCISMESGTLAEEIGYLVSLPGGFMVAFSLMRRNDKQPFSAEEFALLQAVEPLVRQAVMRQWRHLRHEPSGQTANPAWSAKGAVMERAFESFGAGLLTDREQMIVQHILRGHSAHSIADRLGIAEGTVKNHRKSIYAKLGLASQQELFARFIEHMLR
jgi:DNA-binding CsgD family transcriptional regulator